MAERLTSAGFEYAQLLIIVPGAPGMSSASLHTIALAVAIVSRTALSVIRSFLIERRARLHPEDIGLLSFDDGAKVKKT